MGLRLKSLHRQPNLFLHRIYLPKCLIIPKSQNSETSFLQLLRANFIIFRLFSMLTAIHFND